MIPIKKSPLKSTACDKAPEQAKEEYLITRDMHVFEDL